MRFFFLAFLILGSVFLGSGDTQAPECPVTLAFEVQDLTEKILTPVESDLVSKKILSDVFHRFEASSGFYSPSDLQADPLSLNHFLPFRLEIGPPVPLNS